MRAVHKGLLFRRFGLELERLSTEESEVSGPEDYRSYKKNQKGEQK